MPTLHWIGKDKIINHHQDVAYKILEKQYTYKNGEQSKEGNSENKIIHGDNLEALKSLLPEYEGKVDCIYIDPPYNTGNEGWVYNDNVNHPKLKKWLGEVVGKESEDLTRHDKWLCMMYPRLKLLKRLLSGDGIIFLSIDDIEATFLKLICDEIFGRNAFLAQLIWKSRQNKDNRNVSKISIDHEYILCYGNRLNGVERDKSKFKNPDNDPRGAWVSANMVGLADKAARPNLHYDLIDPKTDINYGCPNMGWRYERNTMNRLIQEEKILWPNSKTGRPRKKQFITDYQEDVTGYSSLIGSDFFTRDGTNILREIFEDKKFDFPKPPQLIKELINQGTHKNSIVLDSFAGSATTAHAVLDLNKEDDGNRKFILIEMEDYAEEITAERVRRVINGYGKDKKVEGTGGDFNYLTLGQPLFHDDDLLNEDIDEHEIKKYVWYTETKTEYSHQDEPHFLGTKEDTAYYFYYGKDELTTLNESFLRGIKTKAEQYIIYADNCLLDRTLMDKYHIVFKKIPRDITRF